MTAFELSIQRQYLSFTIILPRVSTLIIFGINKVNISSREKKPFNTSVAVDVLTHLYKIDIACCC